MKSPFPIYCCSIALRDKPIHEAAQRIAAAGFTGIEVWCPHVEKMGPAELEELRATCGALGLSMGVLSPYFSFTRGKESWEQSLETAHEVLQAAEILGVKKIRTFIDCGPDGVGSASASEEQWRAARDGLRRLCAMSTETQFVVETHDDTLADTLESTQRIIDEVALPNLRLNYQPNRDFLRRGFMKCLEALYPAVAHMHWEQVNRDGSGTYLEQEGAIDFSALIGFLRDRKYDGTASVEYCWKPVEEGRIESAGEYLAAVCRRLEPVSKANIQAVA